jgi:hypothetical protein
MLPRSCRIYDATPFRDQIFGGWGRVGVELPDGRYAEVTYRWGDDDDYERAVWEAYEEAFAS